jgi:NAD(P)-dependent dehydrogenase (short-subunit alcohol dehydrogenase family)
VLAERVGHFVVFRCDQHSVVDAVVLDEFPKPSWERRIGWLDLDVVVKVWVEGERLFERGDAGAGASKGVAPVFDEVVAGIEALELGKRPVAKIAVSVGRSFEPGVVEAHEVTVRGLVNVGLDVPVPEIRSVAEGEQGVFGPALGAAAMGKSNGRRWAEIRAGHRKGSIAPFAARGAQPLSDGAFLFIVRVEGGERMVRDLAGKVAIITGSAGGIGKALAQEMAARGCYVVLADNDAELLETTASELRANGAQLDAKVVDVRDAVQMQTLVQGAFEELGRVDYMFNNAGVNVCAELRDTTLDDWNLLIDVNLRGVVHGVHAAYPIMREQGFGHIINTSSAAGLMPAAAEGAYAATKHAVVGLSLALQIEAASFGVRVSVVCPGLVDTPILDSTKYVKLDAEAIKEIFPEKPIPPRKAARRILKGVDRNEFYIVITATVHALWRLHRYMPSTSLRIGRTAVRMFRDRRIEEG